MNQWVAHRKKVNTNVSPVHCPRLLCCCKRESITAWFSSTKEVYMYESEDGKERVEKAVREGNSATSDAPKYAAMHALARRESQPRVLHTDCHFVALKYADRANMSTFSRYDELVYLRPAPDGAIQPSDHPKCAGLTSCCAFLLNCLQCNHHVWMELVTCSNVHRPDLGLKRLP
jgi:hypothetical protein